MLTVIGVVADVREWEWGEEKVGQVYLPYSQNPSRIMRLVVRTTGDPAALAPAVRHAVASVDSSQPITEIHTMDQLLSQAVAQRRLNMLLLAVFAGIATILAAIGIYGVMAYGVTQRFHEIGVRMALGAEPSDVLKMVVTDGMKLAVAGLLIGIVGAALLSRYLESQLYGIRSNDPIVAIATIFAKAWVGRGSPLQGGAVSGHAAVAFAAATMVSFFYQKPLPALLAYLIAFLVAQSRVEGRIHNVFEVFWGGVLGTVVALAIYVLVRPHVVL